MKRLEKLGEGKVEGFPKYYPIYIDWGVYIDLSPTDLFDTLDSALPSAKRVSTKVREIFNLSLDVSLDKLLLQVSTSLLKSVPALAPMNWIELKISPKDKSKKYDSLSYRLARLINNLVVLAEEQKYPVVLLFDQIGKTYGKPNWFYIFHSSYSLSRTCETPKFIISFLF